jgi:flagellar export protein FliJ
MAIYKYRLQKLLDYKTSMEDKKKNELHLAFMRLKNEKDKLIQLKKRLNESNSTFQQKTSQGMTLNELKILANYIDYYKR